MIETETLVQWFEHSERETAEARYDSETSRDFYDGYQWTSEEIEDLKEKGVQPIVANRIKPKVDALVGLERSQRTDPRAIPRNPTDEDGADAATKSLRHVADNVMFDRKRTAVMENLYTEGTGAVIWLVSLLPNGQKEIECKRIPWDRFFYDPQSSEKDFSDARYLGEVLWMDLKDAKQEFPNNADLLEELVNSGQGSYDRTYDDKPRYMRWADKSRKRVRIIRIFYREGKHWYQAIFSKGGTIDTRKLPFKDEKGRYFHPVVAQSAFIDRNNNRYGIVKQMRDLQRESNARRAKSFRELGQDQMRINPELEHRKEEFRREQAKSNGIFIARAGEIDLMTRGDRVSGQAEFMQDARNELDATGINPTLQGKTERQISGRALQAQQQAGMLELGPVFEAKQMFNINCYRMMWRLIRQFWDDERWVRVTDEEGKAEFVGINRQMTVGETLIKEFGRIPEEQQNNPLLNAPAQENGQPVRENVLADLDIDINIDDGADIATLKGEQFELLANSGVLQLLGQRDLNIILELIPNLTDRRKLIERISGDDSPEAQAAQQQQAAVAQQAQAIELEGMQIDNAKKRSEALLNEAKAQRELLGI